MKTGNMNSSDRKQAKQLEDLIKDCHAKIAKLVTILDEIVVEKEGLEDELGRIYNLGYHNKTND